MIGLSNSKGEGTMTKENKFSQLCNQWTESVRYQVKPSTYGVYLTMIEKHILPDLTESGSILEYPAAYCVFA